MLRFPLRLFLRLLQPFPDGGSFLPAHPAAGELLESRRDGVRVPAFEKDQVAGLFGSGVLLQGKIHMVFLRHMGKGFDIFIVTDASGSRTAENETAAETRFRQEGIFLTTVEMVLFEWLRKAGTPEFKDIQNRLIR